MNPEQYTKRTGFVFGFKKKKHVCIYLTLGILLSLNVGYFTYATSTQEIVDLGKSYCPSTEFCNDKTIDNDNKSCCTPCSCEDECIYSNDCCPDSPSRASRPIGHSICTDSYIRNDYYFKRIQMEGKDELPLIQLGIVIKCMDGSTCPIYTTNTSDTLPFKDSMLVVGKQDKLLYRNMYCAQCNNVSEYTKWQLSMLECESNVTSLPHTDVMNYAEESCVMLSYPSSTTIFENYTCKLSRKMISTCNETHKWDIYDENIETACQDTFSTIPFLVDLRSKTASSYKNVYCYLCNHVSNDTFDQSLCPPIDVNYKFLSTYVSLVSILPLNLEFKASPDTHQHICKDDEMFDILKNTCRKLYCFDETIPLYGECLEPSFTSLKIRYYIMYIELHLISLKNISLDDFDVSTFFDKNDDLYIKLGSLLNISCELVYLEPYIHVFTTSESYVDFILVYLSFMKSNTCSYDFLVQSVQELVNSNTTISLLTPLDTVECSITRANKYHNVQQAIQIAIPKFYVLTRYKGLGDIIRIDIVEPFGCPYIVLNESEYCSMISYYNSLRDITDTCTVIFDTVMHKSDSTNLYSVCLNTLNILLSVPVSIKVSDQIILSLVLTCLSLLCIIVCLAINMYFNKINNIPMIVSTVGLVNLFIAQAVFQFGSSWRQYKTLCEAVGILVHFFWLSAVLSMKSYCVLVCKYIQSFNKSFKKIGIILFTYIYGLPLLLVTCNIIYTNITRNEDSITTGYGSIICHIDTTLMRIVLFLVPILLSVLSSCILYIVTVYRIRKTSRTIAAHRNQKTENVGVYIRLLLFTGISWIFGFMQELVSSLVLQYLFIVTLAGQGIFLLLSTLLTDSIRKQLLGSKTKQQTMKHSETLRISFQSQVQKQQARY